MAITKETEIAEVRMTGNGAFSIRKDTVIKEDGVEISRSFHRHVVAPDDDASKESADVKAMVAQFHTDAVKKAYADHLKAQEQKSE